MPREDFSSFQQKRFGDEGGGRRRPENRGGAPENPNIGKPFKRYIGGDEVQKRASNFSMFSRPPVEAPPPGQRTAPVQMPPVPASTPSQVMQNNPNPGMNPNQMYSDPSQVQPVPGQLMSAGPGGILPRPPIPAPAGIVGSVTGGGGIFGQMPQATGMTGQRMPNLGQPMPQVPQRPVQYSLANRRFGA